MKKQKCESCFRTKPDKAFIEEQRGRRAVYETCNDCRALEARARRKAQERVILGQAKALGLLKSENSKRETLI